MPHEYPKPRATLELCDEGSFTKTISDRDVFRFADASGDYNPLYIDDAYAKNTAFGRRVAHGILTAGIISTVLGSEIPGLGTIFVELTIKFLKPVFINDTITATAMVQEIINPVRVRMLVACINQHGEDVAIGNAIVIPPKETKIVMPRGQEG
ncbi:MAG TPA: MaoC family dehydratase [Phycisphaerae bacterium]|nr:MaoC family dehydratase [Phycisphaerae bacterium]